MKTAVAIVFCLLSFALFADTLDLRSGDGVCKVDVEHGARIVSWTVRGEDAAGTVYILNRHFLAPPFRNTIA